MKISIDTMILQAKLSHNEIDDILSHISSAYSYQSKGYDYNLSLKQYGVFIQLRPKYGFKFNAKITLQTAFFKLKEVPQSILDILKLNWSITSLQIAFDSHTSLANSFTFKHHGNIKHKQIIDENGHKTLYFGAFNPANKNNRSIRYDRNEKEISLEFESGGNHLFSNRYEVRLSFKIGEQPLNNVNHELISKRLSRHIFIPNIGAMDTDGYTKRKFSKIAEDYGRLDGYYRDEKTQLKAIAKAHREPLEQHYNDKKERLFNFINYGGVLN
ncbi:hypothetical protein AB1K83_06220 [Sporosarcina sp. 179-K 3D1 HS]|uniref:hypothetical protein n=1 Tax=Sporosarcina sp. 179-K 3D1 HS TaxID=3232169 RepID=UPI0039A37944